MENQRSESELLANIRRLTVRVLDNLDEGSRNRTLDEQQKRLLSSTGPVYYDSGGSSRRKTSRNEQRKPQAA